MRAASTVFYYGLLVAFAQALRAPAPELVGADDDVEGFVERLRDPGHNMPGSPSS